MNPTPQQTANGAAKPAPTLATTAKPTPPPRTSMLAGVTSGRKEKPLRVLLYGVEGIGKSTFAACAPAPIFLCAEDGTSELDVARLPQPTTWREVFDCIEDLTNAQHPYKTLVIDTLDWLEPLVWSAVIAAAGKSSIKSIEDFGFNKGYTAAVDEWRRLTNALDMLRTKRGMHIVLLSHAKQAKQKNPEGDDWDRYSLKIHKEAAGHLKEWSDAVLFAAHEVYTQSVAKDRDGKTTRAKGFGPGARWMHTEWCAAYDAKNRFGLPEKMPIDWAEFYGYARADSAATHEKLRAEIDALLAGCSEDVQAKCRAYLGASPSTELLTTAANRLRATAQAAAQATTEPDAPTDAPTTNTTTTETGETK